jgi:CRISPR-associated protein Csx14
MQESTASKHILVATLGGQPQIVTFTLDLLLRRGIPIYEVIVVHPAASPRLQQSLARLHTEFVDDTYTFEGRQRTIHFHRQLLSHYDTIIDDIVDEPTATGTLNTIGSLIRSLKQEGSIIHFSISGGRRLMAFLSFSAALLYFDTPDELLHLYTPEPVRLEVDRSDAMHLPPDCGQRLIEVPFARAVQPLLSSMLNRLPSTTIQAREAQMKRDEEQHCAQVLNALTEKQRQVLRALASGLHPSEAAELLDIKPSTLSSHTNIIYRECRNAWAIPNGQKVDYQTVRVLFASFHFPAEQSVPEGQRESIQVSLEKK